MPVSERRAIERKYVAGTGSGLGWLASEALAAGPLRVDLMSQFAELAEGGFGEEPA